MTALFDSLWTGTEASRAVLQTLIALAPLSCSQRAVHHQPGVMAGQSWRYLLMQWNLRQCLLLSNAHQGHKFNLHEYLNSYVCKEGCEFNP